MNIKNFYYKEYFEDIDFNFVLKGKKPTDTDVDKITEKNKKLCEEKFRKNIIPAPECVTHRLRLKVLYPGLVTGVGIVHETSVTGEFKLGMHFDHTYGFPIIYGSSVKGVLREYLKEVLEDDQDKKDMETAIFDGGTSIYDRDVFFDAVIVKGNKNGCILDKDAITPHKDGPLKNPIPITFMKIAPGCTIEFRFKLVTSVVKDKTITADEKLKYFKEILTTFGIGAKTNVGYGQLAEI